MNAPFPFGFPAPTAVYYAFYALTMAIHALLLSYVLAGSGYLALAMIRGHRAEDPLASALRDWLPFALGVNITAGVAPLLFLQVLFKHELYSSNLLLSHRWMIMLPILMIGFYLLYLVKTDRFLKWPRAARAAVMAAVCGAFVFTGYSWTENHLVSLRQAEWAEMYASGRMFFGNKESVVRFIGWLGGSAPIMLTVAAWQVRAAQRAPEIIAQAAASIGRLAIFGIAVAVIAASGYVSFVGADIRARMLSSFALPYVVAGLLGVAVQLAGWALIWSRRALHARVLVVLSIAAGAILLCTTVLREVVRTSRVDVAALAPEHARIAEAGGFFAFLAFFLINAAVIAWVIRAVARATRTPA